jgi:hypothetical protein
MDYQVIQSNEIVWCPGDDRHILVVKKNSDIIGLNWCQGDEIEFFIKHYNYIDHDLTNFYNSVSMHLSGTTELDRINQAIWAFFEYKDA